MIIQSDMCLKLIIVYLKNPIDKGYPMRRCDILNVVKKMLRIILVGNSKVSRRGKFMWATKGV